MFSILNRALSWAITSFGNKFCLKKRSRLIKASDHRFHVKFMQLEIGLLLLFHENRHEDNKGISKHLRFRWQQLLGLLHNITIALKSTRPNKTETKIIAEKI